MKHQNNKHPKQKQKPKNTKYHSYSDDSNWDEMVGLLQEAKKLQTNDPRYQAILLSYFRNT